MGVVVPVLTANERSNRSIQRLWVVGPGRKMRRLVGDQRARDTFESLPRTAPGSRAIVFCSRSQGKSSVQLGVGSAPPSTLWEPENQAIVDLAWRDEQTVVILTRVQSVDTGDPTIINWLRYKHDGEGTTADQACELWQITLGAEPVLIAAGLGRISNLVADETTLYFTATDIRSDELAPATRVYRHSMGASGCDLISESTRTVDALGVGSGTLYSVSTGEAPGVPTPPYLWTLGNDGSWSRTFPSLQCQMGCLTVGDLRPRDDGPSIVERDGRIVFAATIEGDVALVCARPGDSSMIRLTPPGWSVNGFDVGSSEIYASMDSPTCPLEVYHAAIDFQTGQVDEWSQLSTLNSSLVRQRTTFTPRAANVTTSEGFVTHGMVYPQETGSHKGSVIRIHGGPHLSWGSSFDLESQIYAGNGYRVVLPNLRGSAGYGDVFWSASVGQWGKRDFEDLLDFVATQAGAGDDPLYLMGGSYGGFLTNWTIAHDNRFRAAVTERSISNFVSKLGTSDNGLVTNVVEMGGLDVLNDDSSELLRRSPLSWVKNVDTPLLLIHGECDQRCPLEQSEQFFIALKRLKQEAVLATFPGEYHALPHFGSPRHRVERLRLILDWWVTHA